MYKITNSPVSVICLLEFIWDLQIEIWDFHLTGGFYKYALSLSRLVIASFTLWASSV
jgi:hypothetical protein